jgi:hypothetical protein
MLKDTKIRASRLYSHSLWSVGNIFVYLRIYINLLIFYAAPLHCHLMLVLQSLTDAPINQRQTISRHVI